MQQPHSGEVVYRDFVLSVFTDPSGSHIVKIAPTPPTFRAFITLNRLGQTVFSRLERTAALQRLVRAYLAVRDLINTPLQTLHIALPLLTTRCPAAREITDTMAR